MTRIIEKITLIALLSLAISCTSDQIEPKVDCTTAPVESSIDQIADANCGEADGALIASASGGEAPYTFTLGDQSNDEGIFNGLAAGNYVLRVTDVLGCSTEASVSIKNGEGVNLDNLITTDAACGSSQGSISAEVSGGIEPYAFSLNGGAFQESSIFSGLTNGTYSVAVKDASGCETSESVSILSGVSYESSIKSIIESNCAISGCHNGSVSPDLRTFGSIQSNADRIKARTANRSMPRGRTLTQTQIDLISCWVDDGALNN